MQSEEAPTETSTEAQRAPEERVERVTGLIEQYNNLMGMTDQPEVEAETERWCQAVAAAAEEAEISTQTIVRRKEKEGEKEAQKKRKTKKKDDNRKPPQSRASVASSVAEQVAEEMDEEIARVMKK